MAERNSVALKMRQRYFHTTIHEKLSFDTCFY